MWTSYQDICFFIYDSARQPRKLR